MSGVGIAVTLVPDVSVIVGGLALMATGVFCASAASQGFIGVVATGQRSTAAALYLSVYYIGGAAGAVLPAAIWMRGGWPATVGLIVTIQIVAGILAQTVWPARPRPESGVMSPAQSG
jgi:YNFM family putative membrane transporter